MAFKKKNPDAPQPEQRLFDHDSTKQYNLGREMLRTANALHFLAEDLYKKDPKLALACLQEARQIIRLGVEAEKVRLQVQKVSTNNMAALPNHSALQEAVARRKVAPLRRPVTIVVDEQPKDEADAATS